MRKKPELEREITNRVKETYGGLQLSLEKKEACFEKIMERAAQEHSGERFQKEKEDSMRKFLKAAVVAACILAGSGSVYAAVHLLRPAEVAKEMKKPELAEQFSKISRNVVTQENEKYLVSYLGEVSGKNLTEQTGEDVDKEKTYFVLAVEKKGGKMTYDDTIVATPFIKGFAPWLLNIYTMNGGAESVVKDNVRYYIFEAGNIEIFADRGVYLGVCEDAPGSEEYSFDEKTGEISKNPSYAKGLNMLFKLELDKKKADPEKAAAYLKELGIDISGDSDGDMIFSMNKGQDGENETMNFNGKAYQDEKENPAYQWDNYFTVLPNHLKKEFIRHFATLVPESVQTIKKNQDGEFAYSVKEGDSLTTAVQSAEGWQTGEINMCAAQFNDEPLHLETTVLNEDGTLTAAQYKLEEKALKKYLVTPEKRVTKAYLEFGKLYGEGLMDYIHEKGSIISGSEKTAAADKKGEYEYSVKMSKDCFRNVAYRKSFFEGFEKGEEYLEGAAGEYEDGYVVTTYQQNEDDTVTFRAYLLKEKFMETVK